MNSFSVRDYRTGDELPGKPSSRLVKASFNAAAPDDVGAVEAYQAEGTWHSLTSEQADRFRARGIVVRTVYVEES